MRQLIVAGAAALALLSTPVLAAGGSSSSGTSSGTSATQNQGSTGSSMNQGTSGSSSQPGVTVGTGSGETKQVMPGQANKPGAGPLGGGVGSSGAVPEKCKPGDISAVCQGQTGPGSN